jgi:serralysin
VLRVSFRLASRVGLTLLTTISAGAVAAPAEAATGGVVSVVESTKVQYKAATGKTNKVVVTRSGRTVTVDDKVAIKAGKGCKAVKGDKTRIRCTTKADPTRVRVYLGNRNDSVVNKSGLGMTADGGTGNDKLTGGPKGDTLRGGSGADKLWGAGGRDSLLGQDGNDYLSAGDGDDWVEGGPGNDSLHGGNGHDTILGLEGNDQEYGDAGVDYLDQSADPSGPDSDYLSGGSGEDSVLYLARDKAVTADADGVRGDDGGRNEHDTIATDVEVLYGGSAGDRLNGTDRRDVIYGGSGSDVIYGFGGDDVLIGTDSAGGGSGNDRIYGGDGRDDCDAKPGSTLTDCEL